MSQDLYYIPPSQEIFDEMKREAIKLWNTYDNTFWYATEKIDRIKDIQNISDNFMYILAMFDSNNQQIIKNFVSKECLEEIKKRLYEEKLWEDGIPILEDHE